MRVLLFLRQLSGKLGRDRRSGQHLLPVRRVVFRLLALSSVVASSGAGVIGLSAWFVPDHNPQHAAGRNRLSISVRPEQHALSLRQEPHTSDSKRDSKTRSGNVSSSVQSSTTVTLNSSTNNATTSTSLTINGQDVPVPRDQSFNKTVRLDGGQASVSIVRNVTHSSMNFSSNVDVQDVQEGGGE